ncbi:MAG: signal peptidase I [Patescibacteria group bacterium]
MGENIEDIKKPGKKFGIGIEKWQVVWEFSKIFIIATLIVLPIRYFLFQPFIVKGDSMVPNFQSGDYLIVDEISTKFSGFKRGDVIVFKYPKDTTQRFIKRIIGLSGETVEILDGKVKILKDGESFVLNEKYLPDNLKTYGNMKIQIGEKEYFVLGDNREFSYDSRIWGIVPAEDIIGKVFLRLFPIAALSKFNVPNY